jgi:hypothetical protein
MPLVYILSDPSRVLDFGVYDTSCYRADFIAVFIYSFVGIYMVLQGNIAPCVLACKVYYDPELRGMHKVQFLWI